jgi:hypothetical protein
MKTTTCPACHGTYDGHGCPCGDCEPGPPGRPYLCPLCRKVLCYGHDLAPQIITREAAETLSPVIIEQLLRMKRILDNLAAQGSDMTTLYTRQRARTQGDAHEHR